MNRPAAHVLAFVGAAVGFVLVPCFQQSVDKRLLLECELWLAPRRWELLLSRGSTLRRSHGRIFLSLVDVSECRPGSQLGVIASSPTDPEVPHDCHGPHGVVGIIPI